VSCEKRKINGIRRETRTDNKFGAFIFSLVVLLSADLSTSIINDYPQEFIRCLFFESISISVINGAFGDG
jgi:hypothetical protein